MLLGRKAMTNLDSVLKTRDIILPMTVCVVKAMVFPVVMNGCENGMVRKAEHQRIDAFKLWCWRRCPKVTWTARRSNWSILREISPAYSLKGLILKLKLQYLVIWCEQTTYQKGPWCWERLKAEGERALEDEMAGRHHWYNRYEFGQTLGDGEGQGGLACCSSWGCRVRHDWATEKQQSYF